MGARGFDDTDERLVGQLADFLEHGGLLTTKDRDLKDVRVRKSKEAWVLFWGEEPGWTGDSKSIARLFLRALSPPQD
jgi:hypothetical protein